MVSGSLVQLYFLLGFHERRQGSGPNRGQSPVEWGDFWSVRPSIHPPSRAQDPARQALDPASQASEPARQASEAERMDGWMDGWTDGQMDQQIIKNLTILQNFVPYRGPL